MNSYHEIDTIKLEKQKAMQRYRTFNKIANIVRILEIVVAVTFISYSFSFTSSYFPTIVEFLRAFLRRMSSLFFSPHFVFLVGNIIIITLFAKSSTEKSSDNFGDEISEKLEISADKSVSEKSVETEISAGKSVSDNVVDDGVLTEVANSTGTESTVAVAVAESAAESAVEVAAVREEEEERELKVYRRTKSTVEETVAKEEKKELRRSETEGRRKTAKSPTKNMRRENRRFFEVDELSNEEFNKKVEAFIQKQQKSLREEKLALVLKQY